MGQVVFSPLAQGLLTGKYQSADDIPEGSRAASSKMNYFIQGLLQEDVFATVRKLSAIADDLGIPMAQLALAWILRKPDVSSALIGASRPSQVVENVKASGYVLPADELSKIDEALR